MRARVLALAVGCLAATVPVTPAAAVTTIRTGMTWTVLEQRGGSVRVGSDQATDVYAGDTPVDEFRAALCLLVDYRPVPADIAPTFHAGWARGQVRVTAPMPATFLTSRAEADARCAGEFGPGWRQAEFHDGRWGRGLLMTGGHAFWATGDIPPGTRFWTAIDDQPANPWNSAGDLPVVTMPKYVPAADPVAGQFMVMFAEDTPPADVQPRATALVAAYGGAVGPLYPGTLGFTLLGTEAQARAVAADSRVETVEQDSYVRVDWQADRIDQRALPLDGVYRAAGSGAGVNIYVMDTGIRRDHQEFGGRAAEAVDFVNDGTDDCNGHGTMVASAAAGGTVGVARAATLISVKVAGCNGRPPASRLVAAMDWVAAHHVKPAVLNISISREVSAWSRWWSRDVPEDRAVRRATSRGVTVVTSAGNRSQNVDRHTPARSDQAIAVSATDRLDDKAGFANYGAGVELFAPGVDDVVASKDSGTAYTTASGTSFSAPMVAGAAAIYLQNRPQARSSEIRNWLRTNATPNAIPDPGPGSTNRLLFIPQTQPATHAGMTWTVLDSRPNGTVLVGRDGANSDPYHGDTPAAAVLPVLCLRFDGSPVPAGTVPGPYAGWSGGAVRVTGPVPGTALTSRAAADAICAGQLGAGWRMAEFHDGGTGWGLWAFGALSPGTRYWTAIDDQPANPWS